VTSHSDRAVSNLRLLSEYRRHGDRAARDRVIEQNLPLVRAIARRFSHGPDQVEDLVQVGTIGLIKAVEGFASERGRDLAAYAVPTIVGELRRTVGEASWPVHRPRAYVGAEPPPLVVPLDDDTLEGSRASSELDRAEERLLLHAGIRSLSRRERRVIVLRYYQDWSQERIACHLGLSQPQVSRVLQTALRKLRVELMSPEPKDCAARHT
jgi:RNA polymerase sigma-B factor